LLQSGHDRAGTAEDEVREERDQLPGVLAVAVGIVPTPANVELQVATFDPSQFLQPLHESCDACLPSPIALSQIQAHAPGPPPLNLLRLRPERPCRRAAEQRDDPAPSHPSIPSSARAAVDRAGCPSGSSAKCARTPTRRNRSGCCARAASGHAAAPP